MYRKISKCIDKTPKKHYGGRGAIAPLATVMIRISYLTRARIKFYLLIQGGGGGELLPLEAVPDAWKKKNA